MDNLPEGSAAPAEQAKPTPAATKITNVMDLQVIIDGKFSVVLTVHGKQVEIEGRRLKPFETQQLKDIIESVMPPSIKGKTAQEDRYDWDNASYIQRKREAALTARALGIYLCFPAVSAGRPNLTKPPEIREFIQSIWTDAVMETLWQTVQDGGVTKAEYTSFT